MYKSILRKRIALLAAFFVAAFYANAQSTTFTVDNIRYVVVDEANKAVNLDTVVTLTLEDLVIPDSVVNPNNSSKYGVKGINFAAFKGRTNLRSIVFPSILDSIGNQAFMGCASLETPQFPATLTKIGGLAFENCASISSITIPAATVDIGKHAFLYCSGVRSYTVDANNPNYTSTSGVLFNKNSSMLIKYPSGSSATSYTVPGSVNTIEVLAFEGSFNLVSVSFSVGLDSIAEAAFLNCGRIVSVTLPEGLRVIGKQAFASCLSLETVNLPASVKKLYDGAATMFMLAAKLSNVNVHEDNTEFSSINGVLFNKDQTTLHLYPAGRTDVSYSIPSTVTGVGVRAFIGAVSLQTVTLPANLDTVSRYSFANCKNLATVNSHSATAPGAHAQAFAGDIKPLNTITLNVPVGSSASYLAHSVWRQFRIVESPSVSDVQASLNEISVYPNPTTGLLVVTLTKSDNAVLYNSVGQVVKTFSLSEGKNGIDITDQPNGIYMLKLNDSFTKIVKK